MKNPVNPSPDGYQITHSDLMSLLEGVTSVYDNYNQEIQVEVSELLECSGYKDFQEIVFKLDGVPQCELLDCEDEQIYVGLDGSITIRDMVHPTLTITI
jgi:hypothetical protein